MAVKKSLRKSAFVLTVSVESGIFSVSGTLVLQGALTNPETLNWLGTGGLQIWNNAAGYTSGHLSS